MRLQKLFGDFFPLALAFFVDAAILAIVFYTLFASR
jgi:hypothetical protein